MHRHLTAAAAALMLCLAAEAKDYKILSPDGRLTLTVSATEQLTFSVAVDGRQVLAPSAVSMQWSDGTTPGRNARQLKAKTSQGSADIASPFYTKASIAARWNALRLTAGTYAIEFRAYDQGVAYRFEANAKADFQVVSEQADFVLPADETVWMPYANLQTDLIEGHEFECQFRTSFENTYTIKSASQHDSLRLAFLPVLAAAGDAKICITESDLRDYPGMFLNAGHGNTLRAVFAPVPKSLEQGGHNNLQMFVTERESYIARSSARRTFPWRIVAVAADDKQLTDNDLVYALAEPCRLSDTSWIKPGKVAWDWWNDLKLYGVDFVAGINTATYNYYIDFAAANGIEYVILDEGWATIGQCDLFSVVPEIDLDAILAHAADKGVGIILWAGYNAFEPDMEHICEHFAAKGVRGFKVDFMDRDDQDIVNFTWRAAETCARHNLMIDLHGMFKPAGIQATLPNVVNFEGVHGLEQMKWAAADVDQVTYDVQLPFIRQVAGPMDYTQGAMRNASRLNFRAVFSEPMSQGTRCRQLAEYVVFVSPLNMLCDNPKAYEAEPECTQFIAQIPTVWDQTVAIDGRVGEFVAMARRKGDVWYVGGMTNWDGRDIELRLDFIDKAGTAHIYTDGANADSVGRDYRLDTQAVSPGDTLQIHMASGGGFAIRIE